MKSVLCEKGFDATSAPLTVICLSVQRTFFNLFWLTTKAASVDVKGLTDFLFLFVFQAEFAKSFIKNGF